MRHLFASGFQRDFFMGAPATLGVVVGLPERNRTLAKIDASARKMEQVRNWIASKIDADPMLSRTFNNPVVEKNFWDFDDIVVRDQWYVDQTAAALQSGNPDDWDIPEENLARTDEWALVIDNLHAAMQEYGRVPAVPITSPPRPGVVPTGTRPSTTPRTAPSTGPSTSDLLIGGGIIAGGLALILALR